MQSRGSALRKNRLQRPRQARRKDDVPAGLQASPDYSSAPDLALQSAHSPTRSVSEVSAFPILAYASGWHGLMNNPGWAVDDAGSRAAPATVGRRQPLRRRLSLAGDELRTAPLGLEGCALKYDAFPGGCLFLGPILFGRRLFALGLGARRLFAAAFGRGRIVGRRHFVSVAGAA